LNAACTGVIRVLVAAAALGAACRSDSGPPPDVAATGDASHAETPYPAAPLAEGQAEALFAAGCFWCSESDFEKVPGVIDAVSGYAGGQTQNPTYHQVGSGSTGHTEAIRVVFDPNVVGYAELLDWYWRHVDFTDGGGQFCDRGSQYRPAVFPVDDAQRTLAETSLRALDDAVEAPLGVQIEVPGTFWVAEAYHQDFHETNAAHYARYRIGCGRDARIEQLRPLVEAAFGPVRVDHGG
jgi:peptide-methionine (S)-S-oxide reductase